jgi:hypothetical protein
VSAGESEEAWASEEAVAGGVEDSALFGVIPILR